MPYTNLVNGYAAIPADNSGQATDNGIGVAVGSAVTGTAMPTVDKPGGIAGGGISGPVTSPASGILRDMTDNARFSPFRPITGTSSVGGSIGRSLPVLGPLESFLNFLNMMNAYQNAPASVARIPFCRAGNARRRSCSRGECAGKNC